MYYSTYISTRLGTWTENGKKSLNTLLVKMGKNRIEKLYFEGLPLKDCENKWIAMSNVIKKSLKQNISKAGAEFKLEDATYSSFVKIIAFKTEVSASDIVLAVAALLESNEQNSFWKALDILSKYEMK